MAQQPQPKRNAAYTVVFPILDADGDLVTGATGLDSEISKDLGTFADCTNEATELATSSGMYSLNLTADEMNADIVAIIVKTTTTGAKTTPIVLYPATRNTNDLAYPATSGRSLGVDASGNVAADLKLWLAAAPLALSSQRVQVLVGAMANDVVSAAAFAQAAADKVWATAARALTAAGQTDIADAVLSRALSNVDGSATFRSLAGAIAKLVNKVDIAGSTLTVRKTNDTTPFGTQQITTDSGADPIVAVDTD